MLRGDRARLVKSAGCWVLQRQRGIGGIGAACAWGSGYNVPWAVGWRGTQWLVSGAGVASVLSKSANFDVEVALVACW